MTPKRPHWTGWIGALLILLNLCAPVLSELLARGGLVPTQVSGARVDICSAGMPMPAGTLTDTETDTGNSGGRPALDGEAHCALCTHASLAGVLPDLPSASGPMPLPAALRLPVGQVWTPHHSFPLQVRPQPPPSRLA